MVTPRFHPHQGGVESHVWEVARRLARDRGFQIEVLTTDSGHLPATEVVEGITVRRVPAWSSSRDLYLSPAIYRSIRAAQVDLVHCQGYHTMIPPVAMLAARRSGLPYVVTMHSGGHSSRLRTAIRPLQAHLLRPLLSGARALIAVSRYEARLFAQRLRVPESRFSVIPNGADLPPASPADSIRSGPPLIISIGRLERYKGHHRLIEAMPTVRVAYPDARLLILGAGPYAGTLARPSRIKLEG